MNRLCTTTKPPDGSLRRWLLALLVSVSVSLLVPVSDKLADQAFALAVETGVDASDESGEFGDPALIPVYSWLTVPRPSGGSLAAATRSPIPLAESWSLPPNRAPPLTLS